MSITRPATGDPTRLDTYGIPVLDELDALAAAAVIVTSTFGLVPNGSFEIGSAADTDPAGWTLAIAAGNHTAFETSAANIDHGAQALSMTSPGGITGGVSATSGYLLCSAGNKFALSWLFRTSVATTTNTVQVKWYTSSGSLVSTDTLYSKAVGNTLTWLQMAAVCTPPATAVYFKIVLIGVNSTTAGVAYWDGVQLLPYKSGMVFTASGTFYPSPGATQFESEDQASGGGSGGGGGGAGPGPIDGSDGTAGGDGGDSYLGDGTLKARGGKGGGAGLRGWGNGSISAGGAAGAALAPNVTANSVQGGSIAGVAGTNSIPTTGAGAPGGGSLGIPTFFGIAARAGGAEGSTAGAGTAGTDFTGAGASGGAGGRPNTAGTPTSGSGGGGGSNGERARNLHSITANDGNGIPVVVGTRGTAGAAGAGGGGGKAGGAGALGGIGWVKVLELG